MFSVPEVTTAEIAAAFFQATVTLGLAIVFLYLFRRYQKPYFGYWALAWLLYLLRMGVIIAFVFTGSRPLLFWHQVLTGLTALALLWAALVFSQQLTWKPRYLAFVAFPAIWSYVAMYRLDNFLAAAAPMVVFLSLATLWTGWVFYQYDRRVGSTGSSCWRWVRESCCSYSRSLTVAWEHSPRCRETFSVAKVESRSSTYSSIACSVCRP
jgi:hypothetical protein